MVGIDRWEDLSVDSTRLALLGLLVCSSSRRVLLTEHFSLVISSSLPSIERHQNNSFSAFFVLKRRVRQTCSVFFSPQSSYRSRYFERVFGYLEIKSVKLLSLYEYRISL